MFFFVSVSFLILSYYREVLPGEIVQISRHGVQSLSVVPRPEGDPAAFCIFEYVYFARPDSIFEGLSTLTVIYMDVITVVIIIVTVCYAFLYNEIRE